MATEDQPLKIIANESNTITELDNVSGTQAHEPNTTADKEKASHLPLAEGSTRTERSNQEIATDDGAVIETMDTALHNKPGVAEGVNLSGSDRADYYEARSNGKTDSEEELDTLQDTQP
jgi:hypothetical protein